jgi:predicted flap endonuclease-1-like 5' DNA nuclease
LISNSFPKYNYWVFFADINNGVHALLEYREFPYKKASMFMLFAPAFAYFIFIVSKMVAVDLFHDPVYHEWYLLGLGALGGTITLLGIGLGIDRVRHESHLLAFGGILSPAISILIQYIGQPNDYSPLFEILFSMFTFAGLIICMISWTVFLNQTVVVKFRGRISVAFISLALLIFIIFTLLETNGFPFYPLGIPILELVVILPILMSGAYKHWQWKRYPLAARGNPINYFIPMVLLLTSHILWYFATEVSILQNPPLGFVSLRQYLGEYSGLEAYQPLILIIGIILAGFVADKRGRRMAFSTAILLMALLSIFGSVFYSTSDVTGVVEALALFLFERIIEGFLLGLCMLLIWTELGSPKTRGWRLSAVWLFFLGYMALFWAADLLWTIPELIGTIGNQFSILISLIALYLTGRLPSILGREMEMEDLELDFDEDQVKETVDAFLEAEDFESIRSQVDIIEAASEEISDDEMKDILGEDIKQLLPLQRVKGIGSVLEKKLTDAGYESAAQLAGEIPKRLASKIEGLSEAKAKKIISSAREAVQEEMNSGTESE